MTINYISLPDDTPLATAIAAGFISSQVPPTSVAFNAGNYIVVGSGAWVVDLADQVAFRYSVVGGVMTVWFHLSGTTISGGTPNALKMLIPGNYLPTIHTDNYCYTSNNGSAVSPPATATVSAGDHYIYLYKISGGTWSTGTNNNDFSGSVSFLVV